MIEQFRWLAAAIAAHKDRMVVGGARLQKEIKLLQRLGFPTEYVYTIFFHGPYSNGLHSDVGLLLHFGLVTKKPLPTSTGDTDYSIQAVPEAAMPEQLARFQPYLDRLEAADPVVLELAATYDSFRATNSSHDDAIVRVRRKKGEKCENGNEEAALELLRELGLLSEGPEFVAAGRRFRISATGSHVAP